MKKSILLWGLLASANLVLAQQWELGSDFNMALPRGSMAKTMNNAFGLTIGASRTFTLPFSVGIELGFGNYGHQSTPQQYTFSDGTVTETNVNVSNNIVNAGLSGNYFIRPGKKVNPYIHTRVGWSWFTTKLYIEDPADEFSCHPIESEILSNDNTYFVSGGAGLRLDFSTLFRKMEPQRFSFDFSVRTVRGGTVQYMNVNNPSAPHPAPEKDVMAKFVNTQSQVIHEHHVGYLYGSVLQMTEYRMGVIFRSGR